MIFIKRPLIAITILFSLLSENGIHTAAAHGFSSTVNQSVLFQHQIQNFNFNNWDSSKPSYRKMLDHALAMSYDATSYYFDDTLPAKYSGLKRIMNWSAATSPVTFTYSGNKTVAARYFYAFSDASGRSTMDYSKRAGRNFTPDSTAFEHFKGLGCAQTSGYSSLSVNSSYADAKRAYQLNWDTGWEFTPVANFQSRYVAWYIAQKTIDALKTGNFDQMYLDEVVREQPDCTNKEYGGWGSFSTWKEGQLYYLKLIVQAAHTTVGRLGHQIKVSGNNWSPYERPHSSIWYANYNLRLDRYIFESGGYAIQDIQPIYHGLSTNGKDPETGLPGFLNPGGGYLPANRVTVETKYAFHGNPNDTGVIGEAYLMQHYNAAGVAGKQGSWFGWYGESQVDSRNSWGALVHTNAMMLLRAIPDWDNIANMPMNNRWYNSSKYSYWSPNNRFNTSVIQGWNPINQTLYAVYIDKSSPIDLNGGTIKTAYFADEVFNATSENAMPCLWVENGLAYLTCGNKIRKGIRIKLQ
jgi:hypothetical protein